jgi:hypothetical protein
MRWTLALLSVAIVSIAQAGDPPQPAQSRHPQADANGDGIITREEAKGHRRLEANFDELDTNKDGQLDAAELNSGRDAMRAQRQAEATQRWQAADKDGDGALSREEAAGMPGVATRFDEVDANKDGKVERAEMHEYRQRNRPSGPGAGHGQGPGPKSGSE